MDPREKMKNDGERALEFVSSKYGKEFYPVTYVMSDYLSDTDSVSCYTDGMDPEHEQAAVFLAEENGELVFHDNYFNVYIRQEAEDYVGEMVREEFPEFKIYRDDEYGALPDSLTCESTLEDLYKVRPDYWMNLKVYVKGDPCTDISEYGEKAEIIKQKLMDSGHRYTLRLFVLGEETFHAIERHKQDDFWHFYSLNRQPDGEKYYFMYQVTVVDGSVIWEENQGKN